MRICSLLVPSREAIFSFRPSTFTDGLAPLVVAVSFVSTAKMAAPLGSPMNRTPCGPKARGPAERSSAFPCSDFWLAAQAVVASIAPTTTPARALLNCIGVPFARNCGSTSIRGVPHQYAGQPRRVNHAEHRLPTNERPRAGEPNLGPG